MSSFQKSFLIDLVIGLVAAVGMSLLHGAGQAETKLDFYRLVSDGFFASGALFLAVGGITFTTNGGVFDGLGYSAKLMIDRMRRDYEDRRITFGEYQEQRRKKVKSPTSAILVGVILCAVAVVFMMLFYIA